MATGEKKNNFTRLSTLFIDIGTPILREKFDACHPPTSLKKFLNTPGVKNKIQSLRSKRIVNEKQWKKLYPASGPPVSSKDFDISLLAVLLRNFCGLAPPNAPVWTNSPSPADISVEADITRLRMSRNDLYAHRVQMVLDNVTFSSSWAETEAALNRLAANRYAADIQALKTQSMDPVQEQRDSDLFLSWGDYEERAIDAIKVNYGEIQKSTERVIDATKVINGEIQKVRAELKSGAKKPICHLPPRPHHDTQPRDNEVSAIMDKMQQLKTKYPGEVTATYLSGNPGCGKSELARQIGEKYFKDEESEVKCLVTLNASNLDTLMQSYLEVAGYLQCGEPTQIVDEKVTVEDKLYRLKGTVIGKLDSYSSWLMIVDNVEDMKLISNYVPSIGQKVPGHILFTTQDSQSIPLGDSYSHHVSVSNGMKPSDAVKSLVEISGCNADNEILSSVAKELDFQPLAIACAAIYLRQVNSFEPVVTWAEYLDKTKASYSERKSMENAFERKVGAYGKSMTNAVRMAVSKIREKNEIMSRAFEFLAAMALELISLHDVVKYVSKFINNEDEKLLAVEIMSSSLVMTSTNHNEPMVRVHQVVWRELQAITEEECSTEEKELLYLTQVIDVFSYLDKPEKHSTEYIKYIKATEKLAPHFIELVAKLEKFFLRHGILILTEDVGVKYQLNRPTASSYDFIKGWLFDALRVQCKYESLLLLLELCISLSMPSNDIDSSEIRSEKEYANLLYNLGYLLITYGRYKEAKHHSQKSLAIKESIHGSNHPEVATSLDLIGKVLRELGEYEEAKDHFENAVAIKENIFGRNHPEVATSLDNLGHLLIHLRHYEEAKDHFKRSLAIRKSCNHHEIATSLDNLGEVLRKCKAYEAAKDHFESSLALRESIYGSNSPEVTKSLNGLGKVLQDLNRPEEAILHLKRALTIRESIYGSNHAYNAPCLNNIGLSLRDLGQFEEAKKYFEKAIAVIEKDFGSNHLKVAILLHNIGQVLGHLDRFEEAKDYFVKALTISKIICDRYHPDSAPYLNKIGRLLRYLGRNEEAMQYHEQAQNLEAGIQ